MTFIFAGKKKDEEDMDSNDVASLLQEALVWEEIKCTENYFLYQSLRKYDGIYNYLYVTAAPFTF